MAARLRCEIFPSDLDRTLRFYIEILRFEVVKDERQNASPYVALQRDNVILGAAARAAISKVEARRPPVGVELVLEVDDLDAEHDHVVAEGWPFTEDLTSRPWGLRDFRPVDPDGYYWRITEAGARPRR